MKKMPESKFQTKLHKSITVQINDRRFENYSIVKPSDVEIELDMLNDIDYSIKVVGVGRSFEQSGKSGLIEVNQDALTYLLRLGFDIKKRLLQRKSEGDLNHANGDLLFGTKIPDFYEFSDRVLEWVKKYGIPDVTIMAESVFWTVRGRDRHYGEAYIDEIAKCALFLYEASHGAEVGKMVRFDASVNYILIANKANRSVTLNMSDALAAARYFYIIGEQMPVYGATKFCKNCGRPLPSIEGSKQKFCTESESYECYRDRNNKQAKKSKNKKKAGES